MSKGLVISGGLQFEVTRVINQDCAPRADVVGVTISQHLALSLMGVLLRNVSLGRDPIHFRIKGQLLLPNEED